MGREGDGERGGWGGERRRERKRGAPRTPAVIISPPQRRVATRCHYTCPDSLSLRTDLFCYAVFHQTPKLLKNHQKYRLNRNAEDELRIEGGVGKGRKVNT